MSKQHFTRLLVVAAIVGLSSCATQPHPETPDAPGFLLGVWHGLTIYFSMVGSLFTDCRIYAFPNSGGWYDFGFFLGAGAALGGSSRAVGHSSEASK